MTERWMKAEPIETAPFDDTWALVWNKKYGNWCVFDLDHDNDARWMRKWGYTHWCPLPEPPEEYKK